jgi:peptide/nickel transport system substrate-binding protein
MNAPNAALVPSLSVMELGVMDSKVLREHGGSDAADAADTDTATDWINEGNSAGTGPFRLVQWDKNGEIIAERHPEYWGEAPALERIIWRSVADANTQLQLVQAGEVDIAYSLDPDNVSVVQDDPNLILAETPTLAIEYLALHTSEEVGGPLANKAVRQAIGWAIDYDGIINGLLVGAAIKPATVVPLPLLGTEDVQSLGYSLDLAQAQELFDGAGVGEIEITLSYGSDDIGQGGLAVEPLAIKLKSDLEKVNGLTVNLNPMDSTTRLADYRAGKLQATISPWTPDFVDVHNFAEPFGHSGDIGTAARRVAYGNPQVDEWLEAGIAEFDPEARKQLYINIQKALIEDAPFLVLYQPIDRKPARNVVQGFAPHPVYIMQLRGVSKTG